MRQVPRQYAVIGNGRAARHFCYYLSLLNIPYRQWSRAGNVLLTDVVKDCSTVILLISDSAIESFVQENECLFDKHCVHFSGSVVTDRAYGAHPLMSFGPELYSLAEYREIPWIIEASALSFSELLPGLPNPSFSIDKNQKEYYHALCVLSNNFTTMLWQKFFDGMMEEFHIPKAHLIPIFKRTMSNIVDDHQAALTGPLVREDQITIDQNLDALSNDAFQGVYQAFVNAYKEEKQS